MYVYVYILVDITFIIYLNPSLESCHIVFSLMMKEIVSNINTSILNSY